MKKNIFLLHRILLPFVAFLFLLSSAQLTVAASMPSFNLKSVSDTGFVKSEDFENQVVLVTFFATWCPPCVQEVPGFNYLFEELKDEDFSLLAISVDQEGTNKVQEFMDEHGINYPVVMFNQQVLQDFGGVYGIPVSFLVNKSGNVVKRYTGYVPHDLFLREIKSLL